MDNLGEKFVFGIDAPNDLLNSIGCGSAETVSCRKFLQTEKEIFDIYQFCVGSKQGTISAGLAPRLRVRGTVPMLLKTIRINRLAQ